MTDRRAQIEARLADPDLCNLTPLIRDDLRFLLDALAEATATDAMERAARESVTDACCACCGVAKAERDRERALAESAIGRLTEAESERDAARGDLQAAMRTAEDLDAALERVRALTDALTVSIEIEKRGGEDHAAELIRALQSDLRRALDG